MASNSRYAVLEVKQGLWMNAKLLNFSATEICGLSYFQALRQFTQAMLVRKDSPLREVLNVKTLQIIASGINKRNEGHFMSQLASVCAEREPYANHVVEWSDVAVVFYVLFVGLVVTSLLLALEKCSRCTICNLARYVHLK